MAYASVDVQAAENIGTASREALAPAARTASGMSAQPVLLLVAGRIVALAATFATPLVLTRLLDQSAFGTYKQLFIIYSTIVGIAQFGMAESLLYFLPFAPPRGGQYVLNALLVLSSTGLASLGLLAVAGPHLSQWLGNAALPGLSGLLGAYLLLMLPSAVLELVMTARKRYLGAGVAYGLSDLLQAISLVGPVVLSGRLEWLLAGAVAFGALRLGATLLYLKREFGTQLRPDGGALREQLAYVLPFQLGVVLWALLGNLHYYIVASSVDTATFAIYAVGCLTIPLVDLVATPSGRVMMVRMREAVSARRREVVMATWHDTTRRLALLFFPLVGLLLVTARDLIVLLFTDRYAASVPIFMVWSATTLFAFLWTDGVLRVYADTRAIPVLYAIQLLVLAALIPPLMSAFGLVGAVLATGIGTGVGKSLTLFRAKRLMGATLAELLPWRSLGEILGAACAAALVALAVKTHLATGGLSLLVMISAVYATTYIGILAMRGLVSPGTAQATTERIRIFLGRPVKAR